MVDAESSRPLADSLNALFRLVHPPGRDEYSSGEVAAAITAEQGVSISHTYIWMLRTGQRDNPTKKHLEALARFFGVEPAYFFDDDYAERLDDQLELLAALRVKGVERLALRASALPEEARKVVESVIDQLHDRGSATHRHRQRPTGDDAG